MSTRTLQGMAQDALDHAETQSALQCANSLAMVIEYLYSQAMKAHGKADPLAPMPTTRDFNRHPLVVFWVERLAVLSTDAVGQATGVTRRAVEALAESPTKGAK